MTKQKVTTTYRREFSPERSAEQPSAVRLRSAYTDYREYRRQLEHGHHRSPFTWDDWQFSDAQYADSTVQLQAIIPGRRPASVISMSSASSTEGDNPRPNQRPDSRDQQVQTSQRESLSRDNSTNSYSRKNNTSSSTSSGDCNCGARYTRKQELERRVNSPIGLTASARAKLSQPHVKHNRAIDDSPFLAYGMGDDEKETGTKRTYNVQAKQGIYPSAVRARQLKNVAENLSKVQVVKPGKPKTKYMFDPSFDDKMNRSTREWRSKYDRDYTRYHDNEYKRNLDRRPPF